MQKSVRPTEYAELAALLLLQFMGLGIWLVPLSAVLSAHGLDSIRPYAFAASAVAAFVSPLIFGAMADRHASPVKVLRWLCLASAASMALVGWSIQAGWPAGLVLGLIQIYSLCAAPTSSISIAIVFSRLGNSRREFGPVRASGTLGWMIGCWGVSALRADTSTLSQYLGAIVWVATAMFTFLLPSISPPPSPAHSTWKQRMGWDALSLLKNHDHRVVFVTAALYSIPLSAFYAYTPPHLQMLGFHRLSAWMTLGQIMEIATLFALGGLLLRWRLKWIFLTSLVAGLVRFSACALNTPFGVLTGALLHGLCYTMYIITAQIYLDERVDTGWRTRAQALMSLMTNGIGNLVGYLGTGWWYACVKSTSM
ncbi:MAG: Nucleoside:H symporter, partial [Pedosphaera sp.]|nr:Nucleoside:H symporter [Pedosphaera sp.]